MDSCGATCIPPPGRAKSELREERRGEHRPGSSVPPLCVVARVQRATASTWLRDTLTRPCPSPYTTSLHRNGRRCLPPVSQSARLSAAVTEATGRERPPLPPSCRGSAPENRGSLTPPMHVTFVRQNRALSLRSSSAPPVSDRCPPHSRRLRARLSGSSGKLRSLGERALALNLRPRRHRAVTSRLFSQPCASRSSGSFSR